MFFFLLSHSATWYIRVLTPAAPQEVRTVLPFPTAGGHIALFHLVCQYVYGEIDLSEDDQSKKKDGEEKKT